MELVDFFLVLHARTHDPIVGGGEAGSLADLALDGLDEQQLRRRPEPGANSAAWLLWHLARTEDVLVNAVLAGRGQVLDEEGWAHRLGIGRRDIGTGMAPAEVAALSEAVDVGAVREYRRAVGRRTRAVVLGMPAAWWDEPTTAADAGRAADAGAFAPEAAWVPKVWTGLRRGVLLGRNAVMHNSLHLGELMALRPRIGAPPGR